MELKGSHAALWPKHDLLGENRDGHIVYINADGVFAPVDLQDSHMYFFRLVELKGSHASLWPMLELSVAANLKELTQRKPSHK